MNDFIKEIAKIRDIKKPKIILGCDGGQDKVIVTAIVMEEDETYDDEYKNIMEESIFSPFSFQSVYTIQQAVSC